jgi:tetratricopeptide (TPR) repeat protein
VNPDRRRVVTALAGVAATAGVGAAGWLWWRSGGSTSHEAATALYQRGLELQRQGDDNAEQAIAYFNRAVRTDPGFAEAWGTLALSLARLAPPGDAAPPSELERVRWTAARALALDSKNKDATLALVIVAPYWQNWGAVERDTRAALQLMPDVVLLHAKLGSVLSHVGRFKEGIIELRKAVEREPLVPAYQLFLWRALWGAGRAAEAQSLIERAWSRWANEPRIWVARFTSLAFSGDVTGMSAMRERRNVGQSDTTSLPTDLGLTCARICERGLQRQKDGNRSRKRCCRSRNASALARHPLAERAGCGGSRLCGQLRVLFRQTRCPDRRAGTRAHSRSANDVPAVRATGRNDARRSAVSETHHSDRPR